MRILLVLFLALVITPFVELTLLLLIAELIGWQGTLALVLLTGVAGSWLAHSQGFRVWRRIQEELGAGKMPAQPLVDAAMILFAGGLLLTPGVLTDALGLSLLPPLCRRLYRGWISAWFRRNVKIISSPVPRSPFADNTVPGDTVDSYVVDKNQDAE